MWTLNQNGLDSWKCDSMRYWPRRVWSLHRDPDCDMALSELSAGTQGKSDFRHLFKALNILRTCSLFHGPTRPSFSGILISRSSTIACITKFVFFERGNVEFTVTKRRLTTRINRKHILRGCTLQSWAWKDFYQDGPMDLWSQPGFEAPDDADRRWFFHQGDQGEPGLWEI